MNTISAEKTATLNGHKDSIYALEEASGSSLFYSAGADGYVVEWDLDKPYDGVLLCQMSHSIYALSFNPKDKSLLVGQNTEGVYLIDTVSKKELANVKLADEVIFSIFQKDEVAYVGTSSGKLYTLSYPDLKIIAIKQVSKERVRCIEEVDGELLLGCSDHVIYHLNKDLKVEAKYSWHQNSVFGIHYFPGSKELVSTGRDAKLVFSELEEGLLSKKEQVAAHMYAINDIASSGDGDHFATCSMDKSIKIWSLEDRKLLKVIDKARHAGHGTSVNKLVWSTYNNQLISCSDDRTISIWNINIL